MGSEVYDIKIKGGYVVLEDGTIKSNIYVKDGKIAKISDLDYPANEKIEADGKHVLPGVIDGHVHFMDPSETDREDFTTGSSAAAAGGVTTVLEHTHSSPVRNVEELAKKLDIVKKKSVVDFGLTAHIWTDNLQELPKLWRAGVSMFKLFTADTHGVPGLDNGRIMQAFRVLGEFGGLVLCHCEDNSILQRNLEALREGEHTGYDILYRWRSREAELVAVNTVGLLAKLTQARVIVAHASNADVVDLANMWRDRGARLFVESCPQYFYLYEYEVLEKGGFRKFTPPARLRNQGERLEMWARLAKGGITHISTDHAPSTSKHKEKAFMEAPFGLPGIETTLPLMLNAVNEGLISLERVVDALSTTPAKIYGLYPRKGKIAVGSYADLVIVDLKRQTTIDNTKLKTKAGWSPYAGLTITGVPVCTVCRGNIVYQQGEVVGKPGHGMFLPDLGFTH